MKTLRTGPLLWLLIAICLPLCGHALGTQERFRTADREYRRALAGEADWEQVLAYYRYLGEHSPRPRDQERAYLGLAESFIAMGDLWRASAALDRAIALNENRRDWALYRKGMLQMIQAVETPYAAKSRATRKLAVETYQRLADEHPDSPLAPQSLFFVANNELIHFRKPGSAEKIDRELIELYPNSDEATLAAQLLPTVHRFTDEQLDEMSR